MGGSHTQFLRHGASVIFKIGLTGGIASGKTSVTDLLQSFGIPVVDADLIAREVVEPGSAALIALANMFGDKIVKDNGELDRAALRAIIFSSPADRKRVESILHPAIRKRSDEYVDEYAQTDAPYLVCSVPLLVESGQTDQYDRILVVDVPEEIQVRRIMNRDNASESDALKILQSQASRKKRLDAADDVISNDGTREELAERVRSLHEFYLQLALQKKGKNDNVVWLAPPDDRRNNDS